MMNFRIHALLACGALTVAPACHNNDATTQPTSGETTLDGDDEPASTEKPEPTDDDGAVTDERGPAELEVAGPGRVNQPD